MRPSGTIALYHQESAALEEKSVVIQSIHSGVLQALPGFPMRMCQFHQIKIIVRHLDKKPESEGMRELRALVPTLTDSIKAGFIVKRGR